MAGVEPPPAPLSTAYTPIGFPADSQDWAWLTKSTIGSPGVRSLHGLPGGGISVSGPGASWRIGANQLASNTATNESTFLSMCRGGLPCAPSTWQPPQNA